MFLPLGASEFDFELTTMDSMNLSGSGNSGKLSLDPAESSLLPADVRLLEVLVLGLFGFLKEIISITIFK